MRIRAKIDRAPVNGGFPFAAASVAAAAGVELDVQDPPGDLSSELFAAYDMEHSAVRKIRALRATILQAVDQKPRGEALTCALIGMDCADELPGIAGNLAIVMARLGMRTLLVEADFRAPQLARLFGLPGDHGLVGYLDDSDEQPAPLVTAVEGLQLLPAGAEQELSSHYLERYSILEATRGWPAMTECVITGLPIGRDQEAGFLANVFAGFDTAVLLTKQHRTTYDRVRSVIDVLDGAAIPIAGTVLL